MPYNPNIAERIAAILSKWENLESKKMFGGVGYLMNGNMLCGVYKDFLILRLGKNQSESALELPHTKVFDITGKVMQGWIMVDESGFATKEELNDWLLKACEFVSTLPPK